MIKVRDGRRARRLPARPAVRDSAHLVGPPALRQRRCSRRRSTPRHAGYDGRPHQPPRGLFRRRHRPIRSGPVARTANGRRRRWRQPVMETLACLTCSFLYLKRFLCNPKTMSSVADCSFLCVFYTYLLFYCLKKIVTRFLSSTEIKFKWIYSDGFLFNAHFKQLFNTFLYL